jgi:hypothetical protein
VDTLYFRIIGTLLPSVVFDGSGSEVRMGLGGEKSVLVLVHVFVFVLVLVLVLVAKTRISGLFVDAPAVMEASKNDRMTVVDVFEFLFRRAFFLFFSVSKAFGDSRTSCVEKHRSIVYFGSRIANAMTFEKNIIDKKK